MQLDLSCVGELDGNLTSLTERQMEFDTETDPDTLYELFGEDADSLAE